MKVHFGALRRLIVSAALPAALLLAHPTVADDTTQGAGSPPPSADPDAWRYRVALYAWAPSVAGNLTARGQTVNVDSSFIQIVQKSDSLVGLMGYVEADKGPVGFYLDTVWSKLGFNSSSSSYRNPVSGLRISTSSNTTGTYSFTIVEAGGLYEFARWSAASGASTAIDGLLAIRYWNNAVEANVNGSASVDFSRLGNALGRDVGFSRSFGVARSGNLDWIDPVIGLRLRHQFAARQEITVRGDVGGFGLQSTFQWQAVGVYSHAWQFSGYEMAALIGYRALGVTYSAAAGSNSVNLVLHGPIIGASVRF